MLYYKNLTITARRLYALKQPGTEKPGAMGKGGYTTAPF
jgi:hypothetical protein